MNYKLLIVGILAVAAVVFGVWFWGQFQSYQSELENTAPVPASQSNPPQQSDTAASLESDLDDVNLSNLGSEEDAAMEEELKGL